jgi:uncharacterized membrane protein HdeD (DUF308 family)
VSKEVTVSSSTLTPEAGDPRLATSEAPSLERDVAGLWWLWLVTGIAWLGAALIVLQFDAASITTIGIIVGCMFVFAGVQQLLLAAVADSLRWLWAIFGVLFIVAGIVCFVNPEATFVGLADTLGFLFLLVGVWWTVEAFLGKADNPLWWLGLVSGILMLILAFWTSGQFFIEKAYTLLVFAGIWALMHGITDIVRAFAVRRLRDLA